MSDVQSSLGGLIALCLILLGGLVACEGKDSAEAMLERYQYRLGNALQLDKLQLSQAREGALPAASPQADLSPPDSIIGGPSQTLIGGPSQALPRYPLRRQLLQPLQALDISLLDFLRLSDCELQRLLGERNSVLGKLMAESQQLVYQRRFIQLAELCLAALAPDGARAELRQVLEHALRAKRQDGSSIGWNATAASDEFRQLFSLAGGPLPPAQATQKPGQLYDGLRQLSLLLAADEVLQSAQLEAIYQVVGSSNIGGRLLLSQQLLSTELQLLTAQVRRAQQMRPLCFRPQPTPQARVAEAVFMRFYIGEVQPYISAIHQQSKILRDLLQALLAPYQPWPAEFSGYWQLSWGDSPASVWGQFQRVVADHTRMWQQLLRDCGLSPGR